MVEAKEEVMRSSGEQRETDSGKVRKKIIRMDGDRSWNVNEVGS